MISSIRFFFNPLRSFVRFPPVSKSRHVFRISYSSSSSPTATLTSEEGAHLLEFQEHFVGGRRISLTTFKRANNDLAVVCYCGHGAASERDVAFNFAATLQALIISFCRNNGYAISTPICGKYADDGIPGHGPGYGLRTCRIDDNDLFTGYTTTAEAPRIVLEKGKPVVIEAVTYPLGHHSTSDDSSAYRTTGELKFWDKTEKEENNWKKESWKAILESFVKAEKKKKPSTSLMSNRPPAGYMTAFVRDLSSWTREYSSGQQKRRFGSQESGSEVTYKKFTDVDDLDWIVESTGIKNGEPKWWLKFLEIPKK